ncbi:MAG: IMP dehydrogenase, partial [Bacilli bacterium]|nr:IMP dehydrogenase [Bacilli bacterium]
MHKKIIGMGLTFDDVLLVPQYSEITPDMVSLKTKLTKHIEINVPLLSAAMDTVTESKLAIALALLGGVGVIHKNLTIEAQAKEVKEVKDHPVDLNKCPNACLDRNGRLLVGASLGITKDRDVRAEALINAGADFFVLDSAHGDSKNVVLALQECKKKYHVDIVAGNVATYEGAKHLMQAGADAVKVGMGPGSICTTRIVSGMGVPQITAIFEAVKAKEEFDCPIIADGGIVYSGDIAKAIGAGADTVMLGKIFAACPEAPGEIIEVDGKSYKSY